MKGFIINNFQKKDYLFVNCLTKNFDIAIFVVSLHIEFRKEIFRSKKDSSGQGVIPDRR